MDTISKMLHDHGCSIGLFLRANSSQVLSNALQHTATYCNTLQHTTTHCSTLQHTATHCNTLQHAAAHCNTLQHTAAHCNTLQHTATHSIGLFLRANSSKGDILKSQPYSHFIKSIGWQAAFREFLPGFVSSWIWSRNKFSKVSSPLNWPRKHTMELTFENFFSGTGCHAEKGKERERVCVRVCVCVMYFFLCLSVSDWVNCFTC